MTTAPDPTAAIAWRDAKRTWELATFVVMWIAGYVAGTGSVEQWTAWWVWAWGVLWFEVLGTVLFAVSLVLCLVVMWLEKDEANSEQRRARRAKEEGR